MSQRCPSCGGVIGRDCFNVEDCAWITRQMEARQAVQNAMTFHGYPTYPTPAIDWSQVPEPPQDKNTVLGHRDGKFEWIELIP